MQLTKFVSLAKSSEEELADAFMLVANKHENNAEIRDMCKQLAQWSRSNIETLDLAARAVGNESVEEPQRVRSALFHGARVGGVGLLRDLQDLSLLGRQANIAWITLLQCAKELHDTELESICVHGKETGEKQLAWLETQIKTTAPQAIIVDADKASALRASIPKMPTPASLPEIIWAPLGGGVLMIAVGLSAWLAGMPWLIPSLGPTAYLQCENPAHPSARFYNTVVGHAIGLAAGLFAVTILQANGSPGLLIDHQIVLVRVWAAAIALALTILIGLMLKASHPPAAATTLLVALGALKTRNDFINAALGVLIVALFGEALRRTRIKSATARPS
jgi:hypothetical protein